MKEWVSRVQTPRCPEGHNGASTSNSYWYYSSYGINNWTSSMWMLQGRFGVPDGDWFTAGVSATKLMQIRRPSDTIGFGETWESPDISNWSDAYFNPRHNKTAHVAMIDGSVGGKKLGDISHNGTLVYDHSYLHSMPDEDVHTWALYLSPWW